MRPIKQCVAVFFLLLLPATFGCSGLIGDPDSPSSDPDSPPVQTPPDGTPPLVNGPPPSPASCSLPAARIWKLTPRQYDSSVRALFTGAASAQRDLEGLLSLDERRFQNEADHNDMAVPYVSELVDHAEQIAATVAENPGRIAPCLGNATPDDACIASSFQGLIERAYRRQATSAEVTAMADYVRNRTKVDGIKRAIADAITAILTSPSFLFRSELGSDARAQTFALSAVEKASALSYFLLDGPPDEPLRMAAATGGLTDVAGVAAQARRLLATPTAAAGLLRFFGEYTQSFDVTSVGKDARLFPKFDAALAADMANEVPAFVANVMTEGGGRFETLFSAPYSMVTPRLAAHYGVSVAGTGWTRASFPADQRAGFLTQSGFLSTQARPTYGDPVLRGKFIRERLLCARTPPPPDNVPPLKDTPTGQQPKTMRDRLAQHRNDPACSSCHMLMDPLGLPLERYDAIGKYRLKEGTQTIDPSGGLYGFGTPIDFKDAIEMARVLSVHPQAQGCFIESVFYYAYGRAPSGDDACELDRLKRAFLKTNGSIGELMVETVASTHFLNRRRTP